ncbi:tetratricopeptide repeat protein [Sphingomonas tabacisoli]|uniref:Tetratricopeptide repeat protein n=1 Tax=Sphingomonas tabacisoli TaxID=2249466 RepID=A0ABW4HXW6_9SPHN
MRKLVLGVALLVLSQPAAAARPQDDARQIAAVWTDEQRAAFDAEQRGDAAAALAAAARLEALAASSRPRGPAYVQALLSTAWQVRSQFSTPAELLARPEPTSDQLAVHALWRALRIEAMARGGETGQAHDELLLMRKEALRDKLADSDLPLLRIAEHVAVARIELANRNYRGAAQRFSRAAEIEAKVGASEPPVWHQPLDSSLGAALLKAGDARPALEALTRALARRPDNVWALWGRGQAQKASGNVAGADASMREVDKRWSGDRKWLTLDRL